MSFLFFLLFSFQVVQDDPEIFHQWRSERRRLCRGHLELYGHEFARLSGAIIDPDRCKVGARAGLNVHDVINQSEQAEYYSDLKDCFQLKFCEDDRLANGKNESLFNTYR